MNSTVELLLLQEHLEDLRKSGLTDETIQKAKLRSLTQAEVEKALKFKLPKLPTGQEFSAIEFPYNEKFSRFKLFPSVCYKPEETPKKYLQAAKTGVQIYWPFSEIKKRLIEFPQEPLYITEGEKKALCGAQHGFSILGLGGIWNWKAKGNDEPVSEIFNLPLLDRMIMLVPDSDWIQKKQVMLAVFRLGHQLKLLGADVRVVNLHLDANSAKMGLDDFIVAKGADSFQALISRAISLKHKIFKDNKMTETTITKKENSKKDLIELSDEVEPPAKEPEIVTVKGKANDVRRILCEMSYSFRYNLVLLDLEFRQRQGDWRRLENRDLNLIFQQIRQYEGFEKFPSGQIFEIIDCPVISTTFDPFKDFYSKNQWDGKPRIDEVLNCVEIFNPQNKFLFKNWVVNSVPCMMGIAKEKNETCLVFQGDNQGGYKTTFLQDLFERVPEFRQYRIAEKNINPDSKDSLKAMAENGLINLDELDALSKVESSAIKLIFSLDQIKYRMPYARIGSCLPRRANFCGTVNELGFLNDETGSRRYFVFKIKKIHWSKFQEIDLRQFWMEAHHLWQDGYEYWLNPEGIKFVNEQNEEFARHTVAEELLMAKVPRANTTPDNSASWYTTTEIASFLLGDKLVTNAFTRELGRALKKHGYKRKTIDGNYKNNVVLP